MVGPFPPPVLGMAAVNAAVSKRLTAAGTGPVIIDVAAASLDRAWWVRLRRLSRVLLGLARLLVTRRLRGATFYISVSGGFGQAYEVLFVVVARLRRMNSFLHHHSFAYLVAPNRLSKLLFQIAGGRAVHVALSSGMAEQLRRLYRVSRVTEVSNTVFLVDDQWSTPVPRCSLRTLGFLSNISREKGALDFINLCAAADAAGLPVNAKLAGPFRDSSIEYLIRDRLRGMVNVECVGPKYGADKDAFLSAVDVLIFPTRYLNEAEPLVIHEAMSRCVPVIAYGRGAIPEILGPDCGRVISPSVPFVSEAFQQIETWIQNPSVFQRVSRGAFDRFSELRSQSERHWQSLLSSLIGDSDSRTSSVSLSGEAPSKTSLR